MNGTTSCLDDVLVGYDCQARFRDGTVDTARIFEPPSTNPDAPRALVKVLAWRRAYFEFGAFTHFEPIWLSREEAIAKGFISGKEQP